MTHVAFYFRLHQPMRLHPDRDKFIWNEMDRERFHVAAEKSYLPTLKLFATLISENPGFKIMLGMSGTFMEQAEKYGPEVIRLLQGLFDAGEGARVEYLDETYYHSYAGLFADPVKREFRDQVSLHRDCMKQFFGLRPHCFCHTDFIYSNDIAAVVSDMGYRAMLCETQPSTVPENSPLTPPNSVLRAKDSDLLVIPRNKALSDELSNGLNRRRLTAADFVKRLSEAGENAVILIGCDLEMSESGIGGKGNGKAQEFWKALPQALADCGEIEVMTASDLVKRFEGADCPEIDIDAPSETLLSRVLLPDTTVAHELFKDIEHLEADARKAGGDLFKKWRYLTASDHLSFLRENIFRQRKAGLSRLVPVGAPPPSPYGDSVAAPAHIITRKIDNLDVTIKRFQVLKRREKTAVLIISPETGKLPPEMGALAQYISGKSGGLGEVVSALCNGLVERGIEVHLATLNLKKRFQKESGMDEAGWRQLRHRVDPDRIHLVSSSIFNEYMSAYSGDPILTAAEFQREIVNHVITDVSAKSQGKLILHTHDWMAGGAVTAYAKSRGFPLLHTVHNIFTERIPLGLLRGIDINSMAYELYLSDENRRPYLDCQATAIKSATLVNFVGEQFLKEVVDDYFLDRTIVPWSVRNEVKQKYHHNAALSIINAPAPHMYPERCDALVRKYGPDDNVLEAKKENRIAFQKRMGLTVNPDAILLFWPSRLDPVQKGVDLLMEIALRFVLAHNDVQIAVIANGVGDSRQYTEALGAMAYGSGGRMAFYPFDEDLSMLGYAAASDVFGASLYEPCGQIDQVGNLFGATATNRDTGGYHDKIRELRMKITGSPQDVGNGFLFRDYDPGGLWYAMEKSILFHRLPEAIREPQIVRFMREAREAYDLGGMIAQYIRVYERLNGGKPLG